MKIYLIRHSRPDVPEGICYGQTDLDVAPSFSEEIKSLKQRLAVEEPVRIWSSPLQRCRKMADELGLYQPERTDIQEDDRLKEICFGEWEMKSWEEITAPVLSEFRKDLGNNTPPNGESFLQLQKRVVAFLTEQMAVSETNLLITCHAGVIRAAVSWALGFPMDRLFHLHVDYAGITLLETQKGQLKLMYLNG